MDWVVWRGANRSNAQWHCEDLIAASAMPPVRAQVPAAGGASTPSTGGNVYLAGGSVDVRATVAGNRSAAGADVAIDNRVGVLLFITLLGIPLGIAVFALYPLLALALIGRLPVVGALIGFITTIAGSGAVLLEWRRRRQLRPGATGCRRVIGSTAESARSVPLHPAPPWTRRLASTSAT